MRIRVASRRSTTLEKDRRENHAVCAARGSLGGRRTVIRERLLLVGVMSQRETESRWEMPMNPGKRSQRGVIIIWLTLFLLALIGVTSLGIDMAKVMGAHTQPQNAADAAALAGVSAIDPA